MYVPVCHSVCSHQMISILTQKINDIYAFFQNFMSSFEKSVDSDQLISNEAS